MKLQPLAIAFTLLALAGVAQAHTHLESSVPADNSVLATAPAEVMLHFSEPTRVTAMTIKMDAEEPKRIDVPTQEAAKGLTVPLAPLAPGKYVLSWRAVGDDNHLMQGMLHFTIAAK